VSEVRIALGATLLERALNGSRLDGVGIYVENLYAELRRTASVIPACFPRKPWEPRLQRNLPGKASFRLAYGISAALSAGTGLPFAGARRVEQGIDVYHAPDHLIPKLRRVPVVATICDALVVKRPDWIDAGPGAFRSRLLKSATRYADHVIAISAAMIPELVEHLGIPESSISVVHMGVGPQWSERIPQQRLQEVLEKYRLAAPYFLFVGTLQPRKNVDAILQAYQSLPEDLRSRYRLVIAGQAGWGSATLVRRLRELEKAGACRWLDYVAAHELRVLYQGAAAFVFPSLAEGFGIPVLEAFASGVPVVTSNVSSLPEVAGDAALLVDPASGEELRNAMYRLATEPALAAALVQKGRSRAAEMSWEKCAAKTLEVYRKLC